MKIIIISLFAIFVLFGCEETKEYKYNIVVEVLYNDGVKDTVNQDVRLYGLTPGVMLKTANGVACVYIYGTGHSGATIACGVKRFIVLKLMNDDTKERIKATNSFSK